MAADIAFNRTMDAKYGVAEQITPEVRRVVANNPSPYTFAGTNTYLVGHGEVAVIDPGPSDPDHIEALLAATKGETVSHILITHRHRDHIDGAEILKQRTGAETLAFGGKAPARKGIRRSIRKSLLNETLVPDRTLADGDIVKGRGFSFDVIHTPGHAPDHLCFALIGKRIVFSGDHVMGWNTTVVAPPEGHMGQYIRSLERLLERSDRLFLPGHGDRIETPQRVVKAYIMHRRWREQAVLGCVREGTDSIERMVTKIYSGLDKDLRSAAALSVFAHLEHLIERGIVTTDGPPRLQSVFYAS